MPHRLFLCGRVRRSERDEQATSGNARRVETDLHARSAPFRRLDVAPGVRVGEPAEDPEARDLVVLVDEHETVVLVANLSETVLAGAEALLELVEGDDADSVDLALPHGRDLGVGDGAKVRNRRDERSGLSGSGSSGRGDGRHRRLSAIVGLVERET
jgi:hypothetical protein